MEFPIEITSVHNRQILNGYEVSPHVHQNYQWYYVYKGEVKYRADQQEWLLKDSDGVLLAPHILREVVNSHHAVHYGVINFNASGIYIPEFRVKQIHLSPILTQAADSLKAEIERPGFRYSALFIHALFNRLMLEIFRDVDISDKKILRNLQSKQELVDAIEQFLFLNLANPITREDISRYCGFSSIHTARIFKEVTGKTITDRLTEIRLQAAEGLLRNSDIRITDIASNIGFNSFSHFTQLFKKRTGLSPSLYRDMHFLHTKRSQNTENK